MRTSTQPSTLNLVLHSYAADLRKWLGRQVTGYVMAYGFMLAGAVSIVVAIGVGVAAAFHFIEVKYGISTAYGVVGGAFLVLGLAGLIGGRLLLKRPASPVPRPRRQAQMLKQSFVAPVADRLVTTSGPGASVRADPVTQAFAAAAAITLLGWIAASRFKSKAAATWD